MMEIKAIVWDLDGTLIYFNIDWLRCRKEAIKILKTHKIPKHYLSIKESILDTVNKSRVYLLESGMDREKIEEIVKSIDNKVIEVELESAVEARPTKGIKQVLEFIQNLGLKQAICTLNTENNARVSLKAAEIYRYFEIIVGRDTTENLKPHPDHLLFICNKLRVKPSEIIFIGDTHRDIRAAKAVNAISIGLETKMTYVTDLSNIDYFKSADFIVKESELPSKLIEILQKLLKKK
ncbi:MAG: HAD family hydrolase [Promethearchaeota archaeon]